MLQDQKFIGVISALSGAILFSLKPVLIKLIYAIEDISSLELLVLRMLISLPFYIFILFYFQKVAVIKSHIQSFWKAMLLLGFIGFYLASYLDFSGLQYIPAGLERAILFLNPTMVVIISALYFKKEISRLQAIAIVLSYIGIVIAFLSNTQFDTHSNIPLGSMLVFSSAFFYALFLIGSEIYLLKIGTVAFTCYTMILAFAFIMIHYLFTNSLYPLSQFQAKTYWIAFMMSIISTIIPSFLFSEGIKHIGASNGSIIGGIGPISTIILAHFILGESIGSWQIIGTFLVILGVVIISYSAKKTSA